jgi:hypothetical protein
MNVPWYNGTNMALTPTTASLNDAEFVSAIENLELPLEQFRHADHLRLAWIELHRVPFDLALDSVRSKIRRFAAHHQKSEIYHETITVAWVSLLATHSEPTFGEFLGANSHRLNAGLLHAYWSPESLASDAARSAWLVPDVRPLPPVTRSTRAAQ